MFIVELYNLKGCCPSTPIECAVCTSPLEGLDWIDAKMEEWGIHSPEARLHFTAKYEPQFGEVMDYLVVRDPVAVRFQQEAL